MYIDDDDDDDCIIINIFARLAFNILLEFIIVFVYIMSIKSLTIDIFKENRIIFFLHNYTHSSTIVLRREIIKILNSVEEY